MRIAKVDRLVSQGVDPYPVGFARTDLSLVKAFSLPAKQRVELRIEAFNVFDQDRLGNPGLAIGTPTFGAITSADDGRIVQLGVRWRWR